MPKRSLLANLGKLEESRRLLAQAVQLKPESGEAHFNLGIVLERQSDSDAAFEHYLKALECGFDQARLHFRLAVLYSRRQDHRNALDHLAAAFQRDPAKLVPLVYDSLRAVSGDFDAIRYTPEFNALMEQYRQYWIPEDRADP